MITRTFKLCLNAGTGSAPYINVSQYDEGETWLFELYSETGERYIPSTGAIVGVKSDGHGIINTGTVDSEGRVVIAETQQMTAAAGRAIYELSIDGLTHGTANFIVAVERKPTDDAVMSDSDLSLIQQAVDAAETIEDLIEGHDPDEVIADAVDAWLDAHPEATTTVEDGAITIAKLNDEVKTGVFEDMTVGTSLAVMNDEGVTDNLAYKFRQTGGDAVRELDEIVGGTIAWNQILNPSSATQTVNGITKTPQEDGISLSGTATARTAINLDASAVPFKADHVYLIAGITGGSATTYAMLTSGSSPYGSAWYNPTLFKPSRASSEHLRAVVYNGATVNILAKPQVIDLTAMFGSIVADAIYAMEQSSAGSGVAYFRSLFPNDYYAYNAGELVSVEGLSAHETTESNIFGGDYLADTIVDKVPNATKNTSAKTVTYAEQNVAGKVLYDKFKPNTQYTIILYGRNTLNANTSNLLIKYTDGASQYLHFSSSNEASYCVTTSLSNKSVKELRGIWSTGSVILYYDKCGIFEGVLTQADFKPYKKHTYPLDSTLTLRGVPKWNNGLYYDGDIYRHDGSVQRRYGVKTYGGSGNWTMVSGTHVYYLTTNATAFPYAPIATCNAFCGRYDYYGTATGSYSTRLSDKQFLLYAPASGTTREIAIRDDSCADLAAFKASLQANPLTIVYELATPTAETAETADPYQQYQICDGKGTEEYVSETVTPVGHNTFYPVDIVAKVNGLPSDFSTLIAPTEEGFKATRNYTAKQFLIINNQLYRVTANIANGATITPNTNVTAVTIADILTTLI